MSTTLREYFLLDPEVTFLNHGSYGACPRPVFDAYQHWQRELEFQPVNFFGRRVRSILVQTREAMGEFFNADADDITLVTNATFGVNTVARSLDLQPGDEILTTSHEYGAINMTWQYYAKKAGAKIVTHEIPLPVTSREELVESFWQAVTPKTRIIAMSHITSPTALIFPIEEICHRAREAGIITVIDGAHAPGQIDLDLQAIDPDFYTGNCHKWLCAPKGAAFLYVRREFQSQIDPLVISWGSEKENTFSERHTWDGTRDLAPFLAIPDAIQFQKDHDWATVRAQCHDLVTEARHRIGEFSGLETLSPDGMTWYGQMGAIRLPYIDVTHYHRLYQDYNIEVPVYNWNDQILMRLSVQAYNSREDIDRLIAALKEIVAAADVPQQI